MMMSCVPPPRRKLLCYLLNILARDHGFLVDGHAYEKCERPVLGGRFLFFCPHSHLSLYFAAYCSIELGRPTGMRT